MALARKTIPPKKPEQAEIHPFGGCNRLVGHYRTVGGALLKCESWYRRYPYRSDGMFREFQCGVSFVPLEVLESYLEDLLDLEVTEESLSIYRDNFSRRSVYTALFGILLAMGTGLYAGSVGASLLLSFAITVSLAVPFAALWHFSPMYGLTRRVGFAQIVSHEIARRRGCDKDHRDTPKPFVLDLLAGTHARTLGGAASIVFH